MKRYEPLTIFPLFVAVVVTAGVLFTIKTKNEYLSNPLAQTHIVEKTETVITPAPPIIETKIELNAPLNELKYPDTKSISESSNAIRLESEIDVETLTNWYKEKILALGYDSKSFISANSNGNIEKRLIGQKENEELYIEIKKPNGFIRTIINIELSNP